MDSLKRRGLEINMEEFKKKEQNGEPLEWELQLISKDNETRKMIFDILTQKIEIENFAKSHEKAEEILKDFKDFPTNFANRNQYQETEREIERVKRKQNKVKKSEKEFKEEEKKWEKREEDKLLDREREKQYEERRLKLRKRLIEKDLTYDSDSEREKMKKNPKQMEEHNLIKMQER